MAMHDQLTAEIAAPREAVWAALVRDLDQRGTHVEVLTQRAPAELRLISHLGGGERMTIGYVLEPLGESGTAVRASLEVAGGLYVLKRLLTFGAVDRHYLDALAVGLSNLQAHLEPDRPEA